MMRIDWDDFRNGLGEIQLFSAYLSLGVENSEVELILIEDYFDQIESLQPIVSRQVAAVAITNAFLNPSSKNPE